RERAVDDFGRRLCGIEICQRCPDASIRVIVENSMPLAECAARAVLSAQPQTMALQDRRAEGKRFSGSPIHRMRAGGHFTACFEETFQLRMGMKTVRKFCQFAQY